MAKEKFEDRNLEGAINVTCKYDNGQVRIWETEKETVIRYINQVMREYAADNYILTLRQLHYQLVTKNWIINHDTAYKKLGSILDDCRYGGIADWSAIEDRGRVPYIPYSVGGVKEALQDAVDTFRIDRQRDQKVCVELWTEKDALSGILRRTTSKYAIRLVVNKGYTSSSAIYKAYERVVENILEGRKVIILYFGDHDPSGLDMVRDISQRLNFMLANGDMLTENQDFYDTLNGWWDQKEYAWWDLKDYISEKSVRDLTNGEDVCGVKRYEKAIKDFESAKLKKYIAEHDLFTVKHIGLTMEQIKKYNLPENPTKATDTRSDAYIKQFGKTCWEVDALKPNVLTQIVEDNIQAVIDMDLFQSMRTLENEQREELRKLIELI